MQLLVTVLFILVVGFDYSSACSCQQAHMQSHFCMSHFVMKVRVRSTEMVYSKQKTAIQNDNNETEIRIDPTVSAIKYHVDVMRMYKLDNNSAGLRQNSTVAVLYTEPNEAMCGVQLGLKVKYLIGGYFYDSTKPSINLCGLVTPWPWVSKRQRKNLLSVYEENCHCQIENWYEDLEVENKCRLTRNHRLKKCFERDSACIVSKNSIKGGCKWHRNKQLRSCKAAARKPQLP